MNEIDKKLTEHTYGSSLIDKKIDEAVDRAIKRHSGIAIPKEHYYKPQTEEKEEFYAVKQLNPLEPGTLHRIYTKQEIEEKLKPLREIYCPELHTVFENTVFYGMLKAVQQTLKNFGLTDGR